MPEINCLSDAEIEGLKSYFKAGGNAVILGDLGSANETGSCREYSLLEELFGIRVLSEQSGERQIALTGQHPVAQLLSPIDETRARNYLGGSLHPIMALHHAVEFSCSGEVETIAEFAADDAAPTGDPAILALPSPGRVIWCAGFPARTAVHPRFKTQVINRSHALIASCATWSAGEKPRLRVEDWPAAVPMQKLRPVDPRCLPSFEFFPLQGGSTFIGMVTPYFKEPARFDMTLDVPSGKKLKSVTELIGSRSMPFVLRGAQAKICVDFDFETAAKVFLFQLENAS